jgi:hypothetical protein
VLLGRTLAGRGVDTSRSSSNPGVGSCSLARWSSDMRMSTSESLSDWCPSGVATSCPRFPSDPGVGFCSPSRCSLDVRVGAPGSLSGSRVSLCILVWRPSDVEVGRSRFSSEFEVSFRFLAWCSLDVGEGASGSSSCSETTFHFSVWCLSCSGVTLHILGWCSSDVEGMMVGGAGFAGGRSYHPRYWLRWEQEQEVDAINQRV